MIKICLDFLKSKSLQPIEYRIQKIVKLILLKNYYNFIIIYNKFYSDNFMHFNSFLSFYAYIYLLIKKHVYICTLLFT